MQLISSDTNIWIDFDLISKTHLPFRLPYTFIMNNDAIEDELLSPAGIKEKLIQAGLVGVELEMEEFLLASEYQRKYKQLSNYDTIAMAIAKNRRIRLLTGDGHLRKYARQENIEVVGTLGILDELLGGNLIDRQEYVECLTALNRLNGNRIRLPKEEIEKRLIERSLPQEE